MANARRVGDFVLINSASGNPTVFSDIWVNLRTVNRIEPVTGDPDVNSVVAFGSGSTSFAASTSYTAEEVLGSA